MFGLIIIIIIISIHQISVQRFAEKVVKEKKKPLEPRALKMYLRGVINL